MIIATVSAERDGAPRALPAPGETERGKVVADSLEQRIAQAMAELEATQEAVARTERELRDASFTATSADRAVKVTVGPQGELTAVAFPEGKYRDMAAGTLAASVLEAANEARTSMNRHVMQAMMPFAGPVGDAPELQGLEVDWAKLFGPEVAEDGDASRGRGDARLRDAITEDTEE